MKYYLFISAIIFFMFGCVTNDSQPCIKDLYGYKHIKQLPTYGLINKGMSAQKILEILGKYTNERLVHQGIILPDKKGDYERRWLVRWKIYDIDNGKLRFLKVLIFFSKKNNIKDKMHEYPILQKEGKSWFVNKIEYKNYPYDEVKANYEKSVKQKKTQEASYKKWKGEEKEAIDRIGEILKKTDKVKFSYLKYTVIPPSKILNKNGTLKRDYVISSLMCSYAEILKLKGILQNKKKYAEKTCVCSLIMFVYECYTKDKLIAVIVPNLTAMDLTVFSNGKTYHVSLTRKAMNGIIQLSFTNLRACQHEHENEPSGINNEPFRAKLKAELQMARVRSGLPADEFYEVTMPE